MNVIYDKSCKTRCSKRPLKKYVYVKASAPVLRELRTKQVRQVVGASLSVAPYVMNFQRVEEPFQIAFSKRSFAI